MFQYKYDPEVSLFRGQVPNNFNRSYFRVIHIFITNFRFIIYIERFARFTNSIKVNNNKGLRDIFFYV